MRVLPRSKQVNVRAGLALLVVGLLVAFWSFSGNQAYNVTFFYIALAATLLALYGTVLLANSRVVSEKRRKAQAANKAEAREWVKLQCPSCGQTFDTEGVRPFTALCPHCASSGLIE